MDSRLPNKNEQHTHQSNEDWREKLTDEFPNMVPEKWDDITWKEFYELVSSGRFKLGYGEPCSPSGSSMGEEYGYLLDGEFHRVNGPAIDNEYNTIWMRYGKLHRGNDLPALVSDRYGNKMWAIDGKYHRDNGNPAIISEDDPEAEDGVQWYKDGEFIRCTSYNEYMGITDAYDDTSSESDDLEDLYPIYQPM